jgi:hypothetical protein
MQAEPLPMMVCGKIQKSGGGFRKHFFLLTGRENYLRIYVHIGAACVRGRFGDPGWRKYDYSKRN